MVEGEIRAKETSKNERGEIDFPGARTVTPRFQSRFPPDSIVVDPYADRRDSSTGKSNCSPRQATLPD